MLARARARGIPTFHASGEVSAAAADAAPLAVHTRIDKLPAVLDFAFAAALRATVAGSQGTQVLTRLFEQDALYEGGAAGGRGPPAIIPQPHHRTLRPPPPPTRPRGPPP